MNDAISRYFVSLYPRCRILTDELLCELRDIVLFLIGGRPCYNYGKVYDLLDAYFLVCRPHDISIFNGSLYYGGFIPNFDLDRWYGK